MTGNGEHITAAVLHLHVPEALGALLVRVGQEAGWVPEAQARLGANLKLEEHLHGGGGLGWSGHDGALERAENWDWVDRLREWDEERKRGGGSVHNKPFRMRKAGRQKTEQHAAGVCAQKQETRGWDPRAPVV